MKKTLEEKLKENSQLYTSYSVKNKKGEFTSVVDIETAVKIAEEHAKNLLIRFDETNIFRRENGLQEMTATDFIENSKGI